MKPEDLRTLANLLLDLQDVLRDSHHHAVHPDLLDNGAVRAYVATVDLVDYISEEIAILEEAGIMEPLPVDPEGDEIFDEAMKQLFGLDQSELDEIHDRLKIDPELDELPERAGSKIHKKVMAAMAKSRVDRWKEGERG